jgi:hypothetical protein
MFALLQELRLHLGVIGVDGPWRWFVVFHWWRLGYSGLVSWLVPAAFISPSLVGLFYFALIPRLLGYRGRCSGRVRIVGPSAGGEDHLYFLGRR